MRTGKNSRGATSLRRRPVLDSPRRGEIWLVNFDPTVGAEIRKTRPAVVVSSDGIGRLPLKLVAPVTDWNPAFSRNIWHVKIDPDPATGLSKPSAVDALQLRGMAVERFIRKMGAVREELMEAITLAIAAVVEFTI
jgi:mRNA interferase MazF